MFDLFLQATPDSTSLPYWIVGIVVSSLVSVIIYQDRRISKLNDERRIESVESTKAAIISAEANRAQAEASERQIEVLGRAIDLFERLGGLSK